jgi:hypothetical protein
MWIMMRSHDALTAPTTLWVQAAGSGTPSIGRAPPRCPPRPAGLRELRLNALPADLGSLTQLTLLEARLWDYHVAEYQFNSILPPSGFALAPLAGLTGLRHLTLHFSSEPRWEGEWHAMYDPEGPQELAHLSALTALESLQLRVPLNIRELPPLPALRALGTLGGVEVGALRQAPQLTRLEARQLLGADAADVQPCPGLQHVAVGCLKGVAAVAPELQHLTYLDLPKGPVYPLGDLQQLTSLQLPGYIASQFYLNTDLEALLAGRCTRLVLTHFEFKAAPLALCAGVRELDLELCRGGEGCRSGACLEPADPDGDDGWSDGMDDDEWDYDTKAWFSRMEDSSVCDLTLRYHKAAEFDCGWLQFLARWVSLERLSLHGGRHAAYPEFALQEFAEECARLRSPLRRLELHVPLSNAHASILQRQWLCAVVEAANPRITCTAPLTDLGDL